MRQAYYPRLWPTAIVAAILSIAFTALIPLHPGMIPGGGIGLLTGVIYAHLRWAIWRRRHPANAEQALDAMRANAPWN